ncbi:hypothetical protein [Tistrella mobilis]|uniref:Secreted protein n=1 Tax=Tistrella mobilis (strain KA081020-065) TaxID=1110502 RepID=I3TXB2_TISMK|nr:hypothetical protein [Tistrella mobilis]AFK57400.1 hypothetical protein TMO_c0790 [Tistrella mobilis KA081020-065]
MQIARRLLVLALATALPMTAFVAAPRAAHAAGEAAVAQDGPLTGEVVSRWLDSWQAFTAWSGALPPDRRAEIGQAIRDHRAATPTQPGRDLAAMTAAIEGMPEWHEASAMMMKRGFADLAAWAATGDRIMQAYLTLDYDSAASVAARAERDVLRTRIRDSDQLTDAQKQQLLQSYGPSEEMNRPVMAIPAAELEAVRPHMERLRALQPQG